MSNNFIYVPLSGHGALQPHVGWLEQCQRASGCNPPPPADINMSSDVEFIVYLHQIMDSFKNAELLNGRLAMLGVIAAIGAYALTGELIPGIF